MRAAEQHRPDVRDCIPAFVEGGTTHGGLGWRILDELEGELKRRKSLQNERGTVRERLKAKRAEPESERRDQEIDELEREERLLTDLVKSIRQRHLLEFLTDRGLIANYAFPEEGVTLKSFIWWCRDERDDGQGHRYQSRTYEYGRPAHVALTELAPNAVFYAEGRRVRITRVDLASGRGEAWRLCPSCSHAELADLAERRATCPSCDDPSWSDAAALQTMLRLSSVIAATNDRESRIGDERDDREPTLHEVRTYIEHAPEVREETYIVDDEGFAFGFEFLKRATFRQVNFGPRDPNASLRVDGEAIFARPFSVCAACGQVQPDGPGSARDPAHARSCRHHDAPDGAPLVPLRLYRDLDSEALRILMPSSATGETDWTSLIAAIERGLVEYYRGDVGHLRATLKESLEPGQTFRRRYLYLYDGVPGGTGYLKQLMQSADELKRLLELARDVVRDCGCDDGCHACLFSYRLSWRLDRVSRRAALALLDAILARWDKLRSSTEGLDQLKNNALFESELEALFVEALRRGRAADGTPFVVRKDILPNGKAGYYVGAGRGRWYLEPQAWVGAKDNTCRADFLLDLLPRIRVMRLESSP